MSKLLLVCARHRLPITGGQINRVFQRITPDNIVAYPPIILQQGNTVAAIYNPMSSVMTHGLSVCMGYMCADRVDRWIPGAEKPDGSYALFRVNERIIELLTDQVASRTIWYVHTEDFFVAATTQRVIVAVLRGFEFNHEAMPWILSSGTLGPGHSWDRRIRCLPPDARLLFDRESWQARLSVEPVKFEPAPHSVDHFKRALRQALEDTFSHWRLDLGKWILTLSGGYDSRAILLSLLGHGGRPKCLTWGARAAQEDVQNDAYVALKLAEHFKLDFSYQYLDDNIEPIERIFSRFLSAGEGRIDNISGYMDGFKIWKMEYESGRCGVIRGDEAFGTWPAQSDPEVLDNIGLLTLSDYKDLPPAVHGAAVSSTQAIPPHLQRRAEESREQWCDRLNIEFEHSVKFAALNDLKLAYVETVNPLLSRRILGVVRQMPDKLRTHKSLFKQVVREMSPAIPYAKRPAIPPRENLLKQKAVRNYILEELDASDARVLFTSESVDAVIQYLKQDQSTNTQEKLNAKISAFTTKVKWKFGWASTEPVLDLNVFAFRMYMGVKMHRILSGDAAFLRKDGHIENKK